MQIELAFRDLKSHRYGQGMEDSLTRRGERLQILLLLNTLATFASWLAGLGCEATGIAQWLSPRSSARKLYSTLRGRPRGVGQVLADGTCLTLARTLAHIARRSARADDAGAVKRGDT